ncbi:MAG: PorT family protein [Flavobacterium sp.]|nr:PorT family protein [Flavobacterium sp.]
MKKIILSILAVGAFGFANAQSETVKFGVKAGANITSFTNNVYDEADGKTGFFVGGLVDLPIAANFHLQPELLYSNEGAKDASLDYLRIPVMAKYYVIEGFSLQAGPQVGFKIGGDEAIDEISKSIDFGIAAGAGYELPMGLFFDARYNIGMSNIYDGPGEGDIKNVAIQFGVGYRF